MSLAPQLEEQSAPILPPGTSLGLLGGGQLGRMFAVAAQTLGYRVIVLDPDTEGPAVAVSDELLHAQYLDESALHALAQRVGAVTTEFENVPAQSLALLAKTVRVFPTAASVAIAQDRIKEKAFIAACGQSPVPYQEIRDANDLNRIDQTVLPGILKAARLGYDGKGQARVGDANAVREAFFAMGGVPCVLEKRMDIDYEISVILARDAQGKMVTYPVGENIHRDGILAITTVPAAKVSESIAMKARQAAERIAQQMQYVGVLCVEFFVLRGGQLCVNEMAPRPHNSGHYTIDACVTSQFEQQVRILAGLPLGSTEQHSCALMLNLLGDLWFDAESGQLREPDWSGALAHPRAKLHLYGKREARPGRKMGHLTVVGPDVERTRQDALEVAAHLGIDAWT